MKKLLFSFAFVLTLYVADAQRIAVADINAILTEMNEYKQLKKNWMKLLLAGDKKYPKSKTR